MKRPTVLLITFLICSTILAAQTRKTAEKSAPATQQNAQAKFKAIWEPANYKEDLNLTDVFFVSEKEGWITGEHGTILYTKDGGDTWTPQLGGDPQSAEGKIHTLRFVDATHGWADQEGGDGKLLRTSDGHGQPIHRGQFSQPPALLGAGRRLLRSGHRVRSRRGVSHGRRGALTERRRSRTFAPWGCHGSPALKASWGTGPGRSSRPRRLYDEQ